MAAITLRLLASSAQGYCAPQAVAKSILSCGGKPPNQKLRFAGSTPVCCDIQTEQQLCRAILRWSVMRRGQAVSRQ